MAEIITRKLESTPVIEATLSNATYKGDKGDPGKDGYIPVKGYDYFTPSEINSIIEEVSSQVSAGVDGEDGLSAYEIAVAAGFMGTEAEWLDSLKGQDGIDGAIGPIGPAGNDGAQGPKGDPGDQGPKGDPGEKGSDGYTPIKGTDYFTPAEIAQITANATPDLTNYATKTELPVVPTAVSAFTNDVGYLTQHQSLESYATKTYVDTEIAAIDIPVAPDLTPYATKTYVDTAVAGISTPDLTPYALKTEIPDVSGKANSADLATVATSGDYADLANKPTIPSIDGLATETYVNTAISEAALGEEVDLSNYRTISDKTFTIPQRGTDFRIAIDGDVNKCILRAFNNGTLASDTATLMLGNNDMFFRIKQDGTSTNRIDTGINTSMYSNKEGSYYATQSFVTSKGYAVAANLSTVATTGSYNDLLDKPNIPENVEGLATETYVNNAIAAIAPPDLSGYALKTELPTMTNYYTKTEIDATIGDIATLLAAI